MTTKDAISTERKVTLYHLSRFSDQEVVEFIPRIPQSRARSENDTINRVCTAPTIEGCMLAHPTIIYYMVDYFDLAYSCPYDHMAQLHSLLERGECGMFFRLYTFEVNESELYTPDYLIEKGYVYDANATQEHWILNNCTPTAVSYVLINSIKRDEETGKNTYDYTTFNSLEECGLFMRTDDFFFLTQNRPDYNEIQEKKHSREDALQFIKEQEEKALQDENYVEPDDWYVKPSDDVSDDDLPF